MKTIREKVLLLLGLFLVAIAPATSANFFENDRFMLSGFGTLGLTGSGSNDLGFQRDLTQKQAAFKGNLEYLTDSRLGIQLNTKLNSQLNAVVQLVIKDRVENHIDNLLELAFIAYRPNSSLEFRLGRLKADIYMLSEYRDVGFAYLWARPISEFYGYFPFQSADGVDVQYSKNLASGGFLQLKAFGGYTNINIPFGVDEWDSGKLPVYGINFNYEKGNWKYRAAWSKIKFKNGNLTSFDPLKQQLQSVPSFLWPEASELASELSFEGAEASFSSLGLTYDNGPWVIQTEIARLNSNKLIATKTLSGYLSVGRRIGTFTPYVVAAFIDSTDKMLESPAPLIPALQPLHEATLLAVNGSRLSQNTISIGTRWDVTNRTALKFQWDVTKVKHGDAGLWQLTDTKLFYTDSETINTFSINLDFIF